MAGYCANCKLPISDTTDGHSWVLDGIPVQLCDSCNDRAEEMHGSDGQGVEA